MEGEEDAFDTGPPPSDEECEVPISYDQAPAGAEAAEEEAVAVAEAAVPEKSLAEVRADFESLFGRYWRGRGCAQPPAVHVTWWRNDPGIYWHLWFAVQRHGGYDVVTAQKLWRTSADSMQRTPPRECTTISYQIKLAYETSLLAFERHPSTAALQVPPSHRIYIAPRAASARPRTGGGGGVGGKPGGGRGRGRPPGRVGRGSRSHRGFADSDEASSGDEGLTGGRNAYGVLMPLAGGAPLHRRGGGRAASPDFDVLLDGPRDGESSQGGGEQEWALCDCCRRWRRLPGGVRASSLPDRWTCEQATWGVVDGMTRAFTPISCALEELDSQGNEVPPEPGAPHAVLLEQQHWLFAFDSAEAATARERDGAPGQTATGDAEEPPGAAGDA